MRTIDADAYKKHLASFVVGGEKAIQESNTKNEWIAGMHTAYREIDNMPTIERPHGEWVHTDDGECYCTRCKVRDWTNSDDYRFCPWCGADMRDKKDDLAEIIEAVQSIKEGEPE